MTSKPTKSEETRARILETALRLFRDQGFEETTMREIAAEAGVATGAAYYYFDSKEALVMAFYDRAQDEMSQRIAETTAPKKTLESRLRAIISVKLEYFAPNRKFLGALNRHAADPEHPLSPFSAGTREIRLRDTQHFANALHASRSKIPADLADALPPILWMYQMGVILFWIYDRSREQRRTQQLLDSSLPVVTGLIKLANIPFTGPLRRKILELMRIIAPGPEPA
jgi:AcrR family transcriptional regulator